MATIKINNGNTQTKKLELSDQGRTREFKGKSIIWQLENSRNSNVASIEDIVVTSGEEIFSKLPERVNDRIWEAKLDDGARDNAECKYSIFWKAKGGTLTLEHDPKISVKPSTGFIGIIACIGAVVSAGFLINKLCKK